MDLDYTSSLTKVHMWLSFHECLLTTHNLIKRGVHTTLICPLCGVNPKIVCHIFLHFPFTLALWAPERGRLWLSSWPSIASLWDDWRLSNIVRSKAKGWECFVNALIWVVWYKRNQRVFQKKYSSSIELGGRILSLVDFGNLIFHFISVASHHKLL